MSEKDGINRLCLPNFGEAENHAVSKVLSSGWTGPGGEHVRAFREELKSFFGGKKDVLLCNSGTSALHLALIGLGVKVKDVVLIQSFTYAASAFPVKYLGAETIFIGSEKESWNMCPQALDDALRWCFKQGLGPRVKAVIPVHVYGNPAKITEISEVASRYGVPVLEDAAEAIGSSYDGNLIGSGSNLAVFSFNSNKLLSSAGGGMLIASDEALIKRLFTLSNQAKSIPRHYDHDDIGYNYGLSNLNAAIGRVHLQRFPELFKYKQDLHANYVSYLNESIEFQPVLQLATSNRWMNPITGISKEGRSELLKLNKIEFGRPFRPLHLIQPFKGAKYFGSELVERLAEQVLILPSGKGVNVKEVSHSILSNDLVNK